MNILIVANHYAVCSARYAADAFTRLGHNVFHGGQPMGRNIWGMQVPEEYVWTPQNNAVSGYPSYDLTIIMDSDPTVLDDPSWRSAAKHSQSQQSIVWGVDNHVRDYRRPYFDHYFLAHRSVSVMAWEEHYLDPKQSEGTSLFTRPCSDMTWLPCAYDAQAFPPSPIPWAEREWDVCMIGFMYPQRWALVNAMKAAGLKVLAGTGLVYEAYRDAYHNSRVALVSSACGDLPIRLFEGCGLGCAVLSDNTPDLDKLDALHPIMTYSGIEEAIELARDMQARPDFAETCTKWIANHTWDARAQVIIDWLEARL